MNRTRGRLVVACLAVIGAAIAVAGGGAGNRVPAGTFEAIPAPGSVTYGKTIAYGATYANVNKANFTHVVFRQFRPVATFGGQKYPATLVKKSCGALDEKGDADPTNDELVCDFGELRPDDPPEELTVVWQAPTIPSPTGCGACLASDAVWLIKEGKPTNGNESQPFHRDVELLGNQGTEELLRASSYVLPEDVDPNCLPGGFNLSTNNQPLSKDNPVTSGFCLPPFVTDAVHLGLAVTITEFKGNARRSDVCVAALGETCGVDYAAADFGPDVVLYVFNVYGPALKGGPITAVSHNGEVLTPETCKREENPECLVSLTYDKTTQVHTIMATSETNGSWTF